jgi:hypothetical protein
MGTKHPLAKYHQEGHSAGAFPPRPIVRKTAADIAQLRLAYDRAMLRILSKVTTGKVSQDLALAAASISLRQE